MSWSRAVVHSPAPADGKTRSPPNGACIQSRGVISLRITAFSPRFTVASSMRLATCSPVGQNVVEVIPSGLNSRSFRNVSQRMPETTSTTAAQMSMPTLEYPISLPGSNFSGCDAAVAATLRSGIL